MTPEAAWEAARAGAFQPLDGPRVHLGYTSTDHWFAIEIQGDRVPEEFVLEVCNPRLGEVTLFSPDGSGAFHARAAGARSPFWSREIHALAPAFRMAKPQDGPTRHLIRVRNQGSMRFDLRLRISQAENGTKRGLRRRNCHRRGTARPGPDQSCVPRTCASRATLDRAVPPRVPPSTDDRDRYREHVSMARRQPLGAQCNGAQ